MLHPWRRVRETPDLEVVYADTDQPGCYSFRHRTATLATGLLQAERRCTVNHEWWHHQRGSFPESYARREERLVEMLSARELVDLVDLGEALAWASGPDEAADELWVDVPCLEARLEGLTPDERVYLEARVSRLDMR